MSKDKPANKVAKDTPNVQPEEIVEDLESLKQLFDETEDTFDPDTVPLLDDAVLPVDEEPIGLPTSAFSALLDDSWQESVDGILEQARARIAKHSAEWSPEDTDELAEALKMRIDHSVKVWLGETLEANIGALREHIIAELSDEILHHLKHRLN